MPEEFQNSDQQSEYVEPSTGTQSTESTLSDPAAPATPFEPSAPPADSPVVSDSEQVNKKTKKPLIVALIIATILAVLVGGSSLVYGLWYQNPNKVVTDALINVTTAKSSTYVGTINVNSNGTKAVIGLTAKQIANTGSIDTTVNVTLPGKTLSLNGSALVDSTGDLYVKVEKLAALVAEFKDQISMFASSTQSATLDQLVAKIDGNWIKVSNTDLNSISSTAATTKTCISDALNKFQNDKAAISEVTDLYKKNSFIVIDKELGVKDGSNGYVIKSDQTALKAFLESLKTTKIYTTLHGCDSTFTIDTSSIATILPDSKNSTLELWVSSWSHQITKVNFNDTGSDGTTTAITIATTFNQPVQITTPKSSVTLSQLQTDIEGLVQGSVLDLTSKASTAQMSADVSTVAMYAENYAFDKNGSYPSLAQLMAYIPSGTVLDVKATVANANTPEAIGYVACGIKGADVSYYSTSANTVIHKSVGKCS